MRAPNYTAADFLRALQSLLPRGRVWPRDPDANQTKVLSGFTPCFEALAARAANLLIDAFPGTTYELLPEWEATLGLPDPCAGEAPTTEQRVAQVVERFVATGGQSIPYFKAVAKALGYEITTTQYVPAQFGMRFGAPFGGNDWAFAWQVNAPTFSVSHLTFGGSFGTPFANWGNNVLQCELQRIAPAHTILNFSYSD
ncbi:phage tail protein [Burkholderia multivorans]|uniref:YmfQ family protein n=1 Tax=Burkholderia multivorans TaxID=87883 RepID=UPI000CFE8E66|nr:putative phage tail protein [Burkholderia multivorans]PRF79647.1 phage tail protein [Burkholderia multivorans]